MFLRFLPHILLLLFGIFGVDRTPWFRSSIGALSTSTLRGAVFVASMLGIIAPKRGFLWLHLLAWCLAVLCAFFCARRLGRNALGWLVAGVLFPVLLSVLFFPLFLSSHWSLIQQTPALAYLFTATAYLIPITTALLAEKRVTLPAPVRTIQPEPQKAAAPAKKENPLEDLIVLRNLRPLGNKKRLLFVEGKGCNDYRAQFRDKVSAERYYQTFVSYAERNPPPVLIEVMAAYTPNTIYSEKYAFILPYFNVGVREDYQLWARGAIQTCTDVLRQHSYCSGNSYEYVPKSISAQGAVIKWTILPPRNFDLKSAEVQELLSDPPDLGFAAVKVEGEGTSVPEKPNPAGPWIGVLFEISKFDEALYGRAATKQLFAIVGERSLAGSIIHGGDLLPDARYWCNAIHTANQTQADAIESAVKKSGHEKLVRDCSPIIKGQQVPVNTLPFQGFVTKDGAYVG